MLTSYLISNAIVLPAGAWASSVIGRKNFFLSCIALFTVASFLSGIAPSLPILLLVRVVQGAGGGGLQPMAQAIMADSFQPKMRGLAFSLYGLVAMLAPSVGPTLGGWIADNYSWRWIFYINIPVGILAYVLVTRLSAMDEGRQSKLLETGLHGSWSADARHGGMQIFLDKGEENWFASHFIQFFAALFIVGMVTLIWWKLRTRSPIMNLRLRGAGLHLRAVQ